MRDILEIEHISTRHSYFDCYVITIERNKRGYYVVVDNPSGENEETKRFKNMNDAQKYFDEVVTRLEKQKYASYEYD